MFWYFQKLSLVNLIYGSLATAVIVLVTLEAAALVLLLGAQVIAELGRRAHDEVTLPATPGHAGGPL